MKRFSLLVVAVALAGFSCERHEFDETRKLHEHHGAGGHSEAADHGSDAEHKDHDAH